MTPSGLIIAMHQNQKILLIPEGKLSDVKAALIHRELRLFDLIYKIYFQHVNKKEKKQQI